MPASAESILKAATRDLIELVGGPSRAERLAHGSQSRFSEYGAPHTERFIRIDQVAALEAECGVPAITRQLADLSDYDLVPRHAASQPATLHRMLAELISSGGNVDSFLADALADGKVTVPEAKKISDEARALIDKLQSLCAALKPKAVA